MRKLPWMFHRAVLPLMLITASSLCSAESGNRQVKTGAGLHANKLQANKVVARRFFMEVWGGGSEKVANELLATSYRGHMTGNPKPLDREGWLSFFRQFRQAFPDARFVIEDVIAENERVVLRLTMRGTHQGVFNGIPATGRAVVVTGVSIERIVDGKIVEGWVTNDALGMLQQLGVIPGPPPS